MTDTHPKTIRQYVLAALRTEILRGRHPAGSRLRQEEIASRLGVSTTPVREALRDLVAEGLISLDAHRGAVVRGLTLGDVQEIYEMRLRLEPLLAERTFGSSIGDGLARARRLHDRMREDISAEQWAVLNEEFHMALTGGDTTGRLSSVVYALAHAARPYVIFSLLAHPDIKVVNTADHARLLELYEKTDKAGAVRVTRDHLAKTLEAIEAEARQRADDGLSPPLIALS